LIKNSLESLDKALNYESIAAAEEAAVQAGGSSGASRGQRCKLPSSGFYGVTANGKRWSAKICYDGKAHNLGCFGTKQEAALAYDRGARQCGKDKALNYGCIAAAEAAAVTAA
jgi:hypothetical protein